MPQFRYSAMDRAGKIIKGNIQGSNILDIEARLEKQGQDLISCKEVKKSVLSFGRKKLSRQEIIDMVFQLEQLTKSGVPLVDGLKDLRDSANTGYYQEVLTGIVESIEGGKTFSESLTQYNNDFDTVFVSLISVGEESGELPRILKDLGETLRWLDDLIAKTIKIMIYPSIVGSVVLIVTIFLMVYLVPDIVQFIKDMGTEIPGHTKALIATSNFFANNLLLVIAMPFILFFSIKMMSKKNRLFKRFLDKAKLRSPIFGDAIFKIKLARFSGYMALLYASGITVLRSLEICQNLVSNVAIEDAIVKVREQITDGVKISESFDSVNFFPPIVIRMVRVGENSGNLDDALLNVSDFFNREVQKSIDKIEPAISPVLTVVMATLLGWIMMSVLGPVWDAVGSIGA
ncbi:MAG: type II secretion system F family protein [Cellvibrionaceae bacterium]